MSLFLTALLHFTASATKGKRRTVSVGGNVSLTCENLIKEQPKCGFTTWLFSNQTKSTELVKLGQISKDVGSKSDRLSVTEDCSLLIKKVSEEDVGRYDCQQYPPEGKQEPDAPVYLSLVNMTELKNGDKVTLRCSVWTHKDLIPGVKWVFEGKVVDKDHHGVNTSQRLCCSDVTLRPDHHMYRSRYESLQCEVTDRDNKQLFPFRLVPSDKEQDKLKPTTATRSPTQPSTEEESTANSPTTSTPTENSMTPKTTAEPMSDDPDVNGLQWLYIVGAVLALLALLIIIVIIIMWKRAKGSGTERTDNTADPEDGVAYASISFTKKSSQVQALGKGDDDDDEGAVTYATVNVSTSSSAAVRASMDPSDLYGNVNKDRK
ncbi:uncharacterized protein LOC117824306 [Xyrichtys novacula]|uniref:Uncharacterized protein LOC117824306 n=1 Tax=Xyrichtys novacula TaxID=13765 RepID=A0AAV1GXD4_XYRNO|nr:uncharacterized protein LOC117824306 [Xyrichtys novacula]